MIPKPIRSIRTVKKMTPVRAREAGMGREEYKEAESVGVADAQQDSIFVLWRMD